MVVMYPDYFLVKSLEFYDVSISLMRLNKKAYRDRKGHSPESKILITYKRKSSPVFLSRLGFKRVIEFLAFGFRLFILCSCNYLALSDVKRTAYHLINSRFQVTAGMPVFLYYFGTMEPSAERVQIKMATTP